MFVDNNAPEVTHLTPGTYRMKVTSWEVNEDGNWILTFQKGGFKTKAFGKSPILKEDGNAESWLKVVGPKGGWLVSTSIFFTEIMGRDKVNHVLREVSQKVSAKYPTQEEQFADITRVKKAVKLLINSLLEAATPDFKNVWFDVDLEEKLGIDKEGNEKTYLNVAKPTLENGYKVPYRVSEDQSEVPEEAQVDTDTTETVFVWVNDEPNLVRQEPEEW